MADKKKAASKKTTVNPGDYPYVLCRDQRHHWAPYDAVIDHKQGVAYRVQKCALCPTKKHSVLSMRKANYGEVVGHPRYQYPTGYQVKGGMTKADLGRIRIHNILLEAGEAD